MKINIVDAVMGAGKTSAAINYMNACKDKNKFIYITPYLEEIERINKSCGFAYPINYTKHTPKMIDLKYLLNKGENIVTTHAMFHLFDDEIIDLCYSQGYILIMDEVTQVIEPYHIAQKDLDILLDNFAEPDDNGILHWTGDTNTTKFSEERRLCDLECLALYSNVAMLWLFPVKIFNAFRESYILTYMFNAQIQKYYYDYYNLEYNYLYVSGDSPDSYMFTGEPQKYAHKYDYHSLINIIYDEKLNMIGDGDKSLSKGWYQRNTNNILLKTLNKNLINFFNNKYVLYNEGAYVQSRSDKNLWTTFTDYKEALSGKGYTKGFIACNARATNNYRSRSVVAYTVNRYMNPVIKNFFILKGVEVDEDAYALSEMLQFIWRSAIRDGNHITVYIPSKRMRMLLEQWIMQNSAC